MADPTSPIRGDNDGRAIADTETRSGDYVRADVVVIATAEDEEVARPAGTTERPLVVSLTGPSSVRPSAVSVQHLSGVSAAGAAEILPADPLRRALTLRNASDTKMTFRLDDTEAGPTDYPMDPGRGYEFPPNMIPAGAVSVFCAVADKQWNAMVVSDA